MIRLGRQLTTASDVGARGEAVEPLVSIVTPCLDAGPARLRRCLASVAGQTYRRVEHILEWARYTAGHVLTFHPLLEMKALQTFYGKSHVLRDVSFTVPAGGITVLLGRNGAGKTTTLRSIMGLTPPSAGTVRFKGREITGQPPHRVFRLGVGYVPEGRQIFPHLDVGENLRLAERTIAGGSGWSLARIFDYFPVLRERSRQQGRSLSGGEQQMLAIARALAGNPDLLMLDEPSQGLAPLLVRELQAILVRLKGEGVTILLVEQNARMALAVCDEVVVLGKGTVVFTGPTAEFHRGEQELKGRYLSV